MYITGDYRVAVNIYYNNEIKQAPRKDEVGSSSQVLKKHHFAMTRLACSSAMVRVSRTTFLTVKVRGTQTLA